MAHFVAWNPKVMSDAVAVRPSTTVTLNWVLVTIPLMAALAGLVVRYLGYAAVADGASLARFADGLCRWDCQWYVRIAEEGYDPFPVPSMINAGNWAFFPLYPMLVALLKGLTGLPTMLVATGLSILVSIGATRLAWPLLGRNLAAYTLFAVYLLAGPFSIYFTTFYTEVLFLFLTVAVFAALRERRFLVAGLCAAALSATRIVGVFIVFAIVIEMWLAHREAGGNWQNFVPGVLKRPTWVLALFVAPLGLFGYMLFLHLKVGDALAFSHVQRAWGRPMGNPAVFVWQALTSWPKQGWVPTPSQLLGVATLTGYGLALGLLVKRRFAMAAFALICLTLPLFAGMASMLRFVAGLAPMPLLASELVGRNRVLTAVVLLGMLASGYFTTIGWMTGYLSLV